MASEHFRSWWQTHQLRLSRFRSWLGTGERTHTVAHLLWPLVVLVIAILVIRRASTAKDLADLISAIASLAWPVAIVATVNWFRPEVRAILSRIRKGKFLGTEFELDELQAKTVAAEEKAELPVISGEVSADLGEVKFDASGTVGPGIAQNAIEEVLREASRSPRLGLMLLSAKIDRAAHEWAVETGLAASDRPRPLTVIVRQLVAAEQLPYEAAEALYLFTRVRNRIVHGDNADDDEIARAIDSGTRLLRLLLSRLRPPQASAKPG